MSTTAKRRSSASMPTANRFRHSLVWFRNDLRLTDNPALHHACESSERVSAVFIASPAQWRSHHLSTRRLTFTEQALQSLQKALAELGISLRLVTVDRYEDIAESLQKLLQGEEIEQLCFNREYALDESRRDNAVAERCKQSDISVFSAHASVMHPPGSVLNKSGEPYRVFTPFKRSWLQSLHQVERAPLPTPAAMSPAIPDSALAPIELPGDSTHTARNSATESQAHRLLHDFLAKTIDDYHHDRDWPSIEGTSALSPYLTAGLLSPHACLRALRIKGEGEIQGSGAQTWLSELIWREFYLHVLAANPRISRGRAYQERTEKVPWRYDETDFQRWCEGRSGFPLVDAAMLQLNTTGWMHNRLRMLTATFLSKYLLIDWRWGERYFMEQLVDGHFASNNGGWQWCASTGTDAAPYFRLLSPVRQAERFDPHAEFIKTWLPQLRPLAPKIIHQPGHPDLLAAGYPAPMVDLKQARERCLSAFRFALGD